MFYSANVFNERRYATSSAIAEDILGPYVKAKGSFLATNVAAGLVGHGGQNIAVGPNGKTWMIFQGWAPDGYRRLYLDPLEWKNGIPTIELEGRNPLPM